MFIFLLSFISAVRINEIEINPEDGKEGTEWIEIYNENREDIDVSGWKVYDGLASEKERFVFPEGSVIEGKEFFIVEFSDTILNNGGDYIILYNSLGKEIDKSKKLEDQEYSEETWQYCGRDWEFLDETKENKNDCDKKEETINEKDYEEEFIENQTQDNITKEPIMLKEINLNSEEIEVKNDGKDLKNNYSIYGLIVFCVLIAALFIFRNKRYNKNEFDK